VPAGVHSKCRLLFRSYNTEDTVMGMKLLSTSGSDLSSKPNPALYRMKDDAMSLRGPRAQRQLFPAAAVQSEDLSVYGRDGKMRMIQLGRIIDRFV
jgi:hypothetical protein